MRNRLTIVRNRLTRRFGRGVIRHRGTVQHLFWCGPLFVAARNRASCNAIAAHAALNDGMI